MVKIVKFMLPKHKDTLSPWVRDFVEAATTIPLPLLPQHLSQFPSRWPFPRGDLYHWIPLLNRFDSALESFCSIYKLHDGPQIREFTCELLERESQDSQSLEQLEYAKDGDRQIIEAILNFSRMLLQNCGNRSIYASSPYLSDLLNSTSLSLIASTLQIGTQLAQRYQASYKRMASPHRHANAALLANHYNIDLDRVQQLAQPFVRTTVSTEVIAPTTPATPSKGKEKAYFNVSPSSKTSSVYANDLVSIAKSGSTPTSSPKSHKGKSTQPLNGSNWDEWGDVRVTYYQNQLPASTDQEPVSQSPSAITASAPATPTPVRRNSTLGPQHGQRTSRLSSTDEASNSPARSQPSADNSASADQAKVVEIPHNKTTTTPIHDLLKEYCPSLPRDTQFELLTKLRVARALTNSVEERRQILAVRILAVTNLAYIYTETPFVEKVLKQDGDEPRRLQLIYQLADLIHPPSEGDVGVPRSLQTVALSGLKALAQHPTKYFDICTALNTSVNHGVLLYIVRKAVAEMAHDEPGDKQTEKDDWRDALLYLLSHVATLPRAGAEMVTAGLVPILVELLTLRTSIAERNYPGILQFLDTIIFNVPPAFQILVNSDGLDAISDLIIYEVKHCSEVAEAQAVRLDYQSPAIDYKIPYFSQQSLKWLFKFIHHMMTTAGGYGGNFDRLLRNLIDSSPLLASLKEIIGHSYRFGSTVWTHSVSILNDFINNEPTSFAVIAEAGLSRELLQAVTGKEIKVPHGSDGSEPSAEYTNDASSTNQVAPQPSDSAVTVNNTDSSASQAYRDNIMSEIVDSSPHPPTREMLEAPRPTPLAHGIMSSAEAITIIPQAFGAICLNSSGMQMFQASNALQSFFEIFESPKHVQCMEGEHNLASNLGATFDELVRHHPPLKNAIINAILDMVARVSFLCESMASKDNIGSKLWAMNESDNTASEDASKGKGKATILDTDIEMGGVGTAQAPAPAEPSTEATVYTSPTPYINAVSCFLSLMFANSTVRVAFMEKGGTEHVLNMAEVASLGFDFGDNVASRTLQTVICMLAEQKPHLVVPSLLKRAQLAADAITPFSLHKHEGSQPYFATFVSEESQNAVDGLQLHEGTKLVKALVNVHSLISTLHRCFQTPVFNHRTTTTFFNQVNLADYYIHLVQRLGPLLAAATKEDFMLQKSSLVPGHWRRATRVGGETVHLLPTENLEDVDLEGRAINDLVVTDVLPTGVQATPTENAPTTESEPISAASVYKTPSLTKHESDSARFKNFQTLRYLLGKMPPTISSFFQILGKSLTSHRRSPDQFQRQSYTSIAEALAETVLDQLSSPIGQESSIANYTFWIVMLGTIKDLLVHVSRHSERPFECITLVLQAFRARKGFDVLNNMLDTFSQDIKQYTGQNNNPDLANDSLKDDLKLSLATLGTRHILSLYLLLVNGKNISESPQTLSMVHHAEREKTKPNYLSSGQLIIELRMAVLPTVRRLWESDMVEKATHQIPNRLIDIIRTIATADHETGVYKRSDKVPAEVKTSRKFWKPNSDNLTKLLDAGFDKELANEALYRCNNSHSHAAEYCKAQISDHSSGRNPIPLADQAQAEPETPSEANGTTRTGHSTGTVTPVAAEPDTSNNTGMVDGWANAPQIAWGSSVDTNDDLLGSLPQDAAAVPTSASAGAGSSTPASVTLVPVATQPNIITIDDLNEERKAVRERLIERCLDVINAHGEVTFEVSDLISTVVDKSEDPPSMRKEMGETLVNALMSFAAEEDVRIVGKKVAAYAHLLALMLQEKPFYNASVAELKENLPTLLEFVKLSPTHSSEESSPWIAHILLIIETLLSEDAQPQETEWKFPSMENKDIEKPLLKITEPIVSPSHRSVLFEYILDILPRIGKDESLALAVLRVLVILTRSRNLAQAMGEKKNIQRLFVMAKQLASATSYRLQSPLMLILRHIIEDDETIKQVMRSDIKAFFESPRSQRHHDVSTYIHQLSNLAIRAPELFVEVTNEMVKLAKWAPAAETAPGRQGLMLKDQFQRGPPPDMILPPLQTTGLLSIQDVKPSTESGEAEAEPAETAKLPPIELSKVPVVENPDGVIHFLLCEILNYKDVEDKDPASQPEKNSLEISSNNGDAIMTDSASSVTSPTEASASAEPKDAKKTSKPKFKWEDHPIFIYRCFLLQCLTELLSSYNRTKVEFINFKRSLPPQPMTPSKPRSTVIHYFLSDLVPVGTLEHTENTGMMKKQTTSTWAKHLLTGLLSKTGEHLLDYNRHPTDSEDEPDLHYVRKFVLENILKAYKDASSSTEPLDAKYSRMMSLADLISHIMAGKDNYSTATDPAVSQRSGSQLKRIMFEKGFVSALTCSIADIDLNFPGAKRAVKHILRPLKVLTQTAIDLSEFGIITNPGQSEEDEIASASSVSEADEREETPDLFRNSTLGMFEPGRDEESSSGSDDEDEEMYEGEYDDEEIHYGDEMAEDDEDDVSEEDEEIEGMGPIEGLPGDVDVEVIMDEDDDDDEDDDEEDDSDSDDDEDSDDMDEDEAAPEILIDEHGHPVHLGEDGDEDDWEDEGGSEEDEDEGEEEDYEGRLEDEEHLRAHGIDPGGHESTIGSLMRALGGDDHEGAVEILQRLEDEGLDDMEQYPETDHDDEEDEEEDEDMEIEEEQFEGFRPPPGMEAVVWDEDSFQPATMVTGRHGHHHRSRHGIPSPFPYFPGGPRDPLGGMFPHFSEESLELQVARTTRGLAEATRTLNQLTELLDTLQGGSGEDRVLHQSRLDSVRSLLDDLQSPTVSDTFSPIVMPPRTNTNLRSVPDYGRPSYRSHRPGPIARADEGMNPLLQRNGSGLARDELRRSPMGVTVSGRPHDVLLDVDLRARGPPFGESPAALLNDLITSLPLPGSLHRHGHALHFHVTGGPRGEMSRDLQAMFGMSRGLPGLSRFENPRRETVDEPGNAPFFSPQTTVNRWTEEAKLLFGASYAEKAFQRLTTAVMAVLIPPALQQEIDALKVAEEAKKKRELEEVAHKAKKEAEEKAAEEKAKAEAKEAADAADRARAEEQAATGDAMSGVESGDTADDTTQPMEGVETEDDTTAPSGEGESSDDRPRIVVTIRGNQIDITDLGIDADFLRELPEELQEEVITSAVAERRSQAAAAGGEPSEIDQEFLDALPAEIRDEIIQQERQDRRRREREEARRQAQQNGQVNTAAQEMDAASILATLNPELRRQVLLEQNEEVLAHLPPEYVAQARAGMRENPISNTRALGGRPRPIGGELTAPKKKVVVQMLDKAGVATLLRLMFVFQQESLRGSLYQVLQNISENRHNRGEVISTLLHILQDGSADMSAVERSFAHLSLRAKQPKEKDKEKEPKTPQPLKRTLTGASVTGTSFNLAASGDVSPLMVVHQCLSTLIYLSKVNNQVAGFFLIEHESSGGLKRMPSRLKGKGKDTKASKFALNSLLTLLDRKLIMESSSVMESLSDLLSRATSPLQSLVRNQKRAIEEAKKEPIPATLGETNTSATSPETTTTAELPTAAVISEVIEPAPQTPDAAVAEGVETSTPSAETSAPAAELSTDALAAEIKEKESDKKKERQFIFPTIPDSNLKLVVNIFVARECSAKTFRDTLITIKNLSCIPGAKAVFGKELVRKAQELGEIILLDLAELLPQIQKATTGTEIQGLALAKFSPSGSDQNKLLRVLTALDHLFDAKQNSTVLDGESESTAESSKDAEKQDLLATLYENSTFGPMWEKLSACLSAIRLREHMLSVATILLPLIESLMVVCKNTTLKDTPIAGSQIGREMNLTSPPPESRMENLFFTFTEEHRKILNDLVRHTPKLMSGTFSLLVKNPKVLEFDNKRNYFTRSIHNRNTQTRQSFPPLQLSVRRDQVFHDSFKSLYFKNGDEMKFGKLSIRFHGEEGVDAGGVTREWFQVLSRQMFDPGYALFVPVSSDRTTFHPNPLSNINPEHLMFFKFIGRVIGKALYEGRVLDCHFSRAVYKRILGKAVSIKDMESLDPEYYKSIVWMLENDTTDIITETFSVDKDNFGVVETIDLIENGRNIAVTEDNKQEYIRLMVEYKLTGSVKEQLDEFLKGFHDIIPAELIAIFNEQELELLISGLPEIDVDDWKGNTEYHNYTASSPQIQWFWRAIRSFDKEERAKLLQFVTGTSKVPLNGFKELEGMNGFSRFNIHRDYGNKDRLPSSHTCFNQLDLPEYESYEALRQQVLVAITAGSEYFGFA